MVRKKDPLSAAYERGRKALLRLLKEEGGVIELKNRNNLRLIMERNRVWVVKAGDEFIVPVWQFNDGVYPYMAKFLKIFRLKKVSGLSVMIFFLNGNFRLDGKTPLQALRDGRVKEVTRAAKCYLKHGAA